MGKKAERKALAERLAKLVLSEQWSDGDYLITLQESVLERPYSMVRLAFVAKQDSGTKRIVYAFSKVCWPDKYDPDTGYELCVRKACAKIAKAMMDGTRQK